MDYPRLLLAEKRAQLAVANPGHDDTLVSLGLENNPPGAITAEQEAALDAELTGCTLYVVDGKEYYWTEEEYERMTNG